ncbi:MAG: hypothetical protein PF693_15300 [Spirochaetia bacterium]|jgi:hypothetical protein|nr:hypothetical protein [Spirochaetia bacterium]
MKIKLVVVVLVVVSVSLFALDMSAGGGATFDYSSSTMKADVTGYEMSMNQAYQVLGFGAFFDATYLQIGLDYGLVAAGKMTLKVTGSPDVSEDLKGSITFLNFKVFGKYPIDMGSFVLFPIAGIEQRVNLTYKDENGVDLKKDMTDDEKEHINETWIKMGVGADFPLSEGLYLRPITLLGYKIQSKMEKDLVDYYMDMGADSASWNTFGFEFSLNLGYKF